MRACLDEPALGVRQPAQRGLHPRHIGMIGAEQRDADLVRPLEPAPGRSEVSLLELDDAAEVVQIGDEARLVQPRQQRLGALGEPQALVGAGMKIAYDLLLYVSFRRLRPPEEREAGA
jgi:hypothetical protein